MTLTRMTKGMFTLFDCLSGNHTDFFDSVPICIYHFPIY